MYVCLVFIIFRTRIYFISMTESLEVLDHVRLNFSPSGVHFLNIALAFIMFGVALDINVHNFKALLARPYSIVTGVIAQFILLPAFTFLVVLVIGPTPTVALGMILVAACPGGNISNFMSAMAKGNIALSISLTAIATLSALVMTPFNFSLWGDFYVHFYNHKEADALLRPLEINKEQMFYTVSILLGLPVAFGLFISHRFPMFTQGIKKYIKTGSILFFMVLVVLMLGANWDHFKKYVGLVFVIVLIHNALALGVGYGFSTLMRRPRIDRRAITLETGIQNSGLALALMFNPKIFPPELELGGMTIIAAWWGIWHIISGLIIASLWSKKKIAKNEN